jgi:hypothetical protein
LEAGDRFGQLTVVNLHNETKGRHLLWECRCDCGNVALVTTEALKSGHTRSCGCLRKEYGHHLPSKCELQQRFDERKRIVDASNRAWRRLNAADKFVGVSHQTILNWAVGCPYLENGRGIESADFEAGNGQTVPYYSETDLKAIKNARAKQRLVPVVPGHVYMLDLAADLGITRRWLHKKLARLARSQDRKRRTLVRLPAKGKDGQRRWRSYVPNWAAKKLGYDPNGTTQPSIGLDGYDSDGPTSAADFDVADSRDSGAGTES